MQNKNTILFLVTAALVLLGWFGVQQWLKRNQPEPEVKHEPSTEVKNDQPKPPPEKPQPQPVAHGQLRSAPPPRTHPLVAIGGDGHFVDGKFEGWFLKGSLDPRGGGVHQLFLNQFRAADHLGRPALDADGQPKTMELIPAEANEVEPSYLMYHYAKGEDRPYDTLGREEWDVKEQSPGRVVFAYDKLRDVTLTKTYTLKPNEYHLELEVQIKNKSTGAVTFQYQMTAGHGLPIEGQWYTSIQRNAMVGQVDKSGDPSRELQDLKQISKKLGGDQVAVEPDNVILYAGVAVQYFASLLVVPPNAALPEDRAQWSEAWKQPEDRISRAQATIEQAYVRGKLVNLPLASDRFLVRGNDNVDHEFLLPPPGWGFPVLEQLSNLRPGEPVVVLYKIEDAGMMATQVFAKEEADRLFADDITVRMVAKPIDLKPGETVAHKYLLYNGPVKVRLLADEGVPDQTVDFYHDWLHLNTLTDYHSSGIPGRISNSVHWTFVLIKCTNVMHWVLNLLHTYVMPWSYGLCIILLTLLVRGAMFPLSRRQAMMSMKMQALAPEIKKLQEKFKTDRQALGMAQMELYRRHGVNPLGSCWVLVLQMPIFLGLYYSLQESIHFRLAPFLWIENLAAPDMLIKWGSSIPWISRPEDYGGWLYLGPYFNLLPVIAVGLMIVQQSMMMPPATDEQQQMQQKMMKYMTVIFGVLFYKVAAGLCLYFIVSSVWGFTERKLLPKRPAPGTLPELPPPGKPGLLHRLMDRLQAGVSQAQAGNGDTSAAARRPAVTEGPSGAAGKRGSGKKRGKGGRISGTPGQTDSGERSWWSGIRELWAKLLKNAEKH